MDEKTQQMIQALAQVYMQLSGEQDPNKAMQTIVQAVQAAQQGDQKAAQMLQQLAQVALGGQQTAARSAKNGAKLQYLKKLRGECPEGYEMSYFKKGGHICKKCMKKQVQEACGGKKMENGGPVASFKCGHKMKKASEGIKTPLKKYTTESRDSLINVINKGKGDSLTVNELHTANKQLNTKGENSGPNVNQQKISEALKRKRK